MRGCLEFLPCMLQGWIPVYGCKDCQDDSYGVLNQTERGGLHLCIGPDFEFAAFCLLQGF